MSKKFSIFVMTLSVCLLISQFIGLFRGPISYPSSGTIPGYHFSVESKERLLEAVRYKGLLDFEWAREVNDAAFLSIAHGKPAMLRFEHSWILWLRAKFKGDALRYTQNPKKIMMADAAVCSQSAWLIVSIAYDKNIMARLISLDGHVVAELFLDGKWIIADPDYGVVFPFDAIGLGDKKNEIFIENQLKKRGFGQREIDIYKTVIYNGYTLRHPLWEAHEIKPEFTERFGVFLSWILPLIGLLFSFVLLAFSVKKDMRAV